MRAMLIWDGGDTVHVPPSMGTPLDDQLTGTVGEQVIETACRLCYDSLGVGPDGKRKGRATPQTLNVILEHKHHSVLEHFTRTVAFQTSELTAHQHLRLLYVFLNRRGTWCRTTTDTLRVTLNARTVIEWDAWSKRICREHGERIGEGGALWNTMWTIGVQLRAIFSLELPLLLPMPTDAGFHTDWAIGVLKPTLVAPSSDHEKFVTLYLRGSRGFSHEQVRHRFGISQRSTRFTDETESAWDLHPLLEQFFETHESGPEAYEDVHAFVKSSQGLYAKMVDALEAGLIDKLTLDRSKGLDTPAKLSREDKRMCRKQARGAARGLLGNALRTDMAFTASVADWRYVMIAQRGNDHADAEIRRIFVGAEGSEGDSVLGALLESRYAKRFQDIKPVPAKDGTSLAVNLVNLD